MPPLTKIKNIHNLDEFIEDLSEITTEVTNLLDIVKEAETEFDGIKTEMRLFQQHLRDSENGLPLITKIALLEQQMKNMEEDKRSKQHVEVTDKVGYWQMKIALVTGFFALCGSIFSIILQLIKK